MTSSDDKSAVSPDSSGAEAGSSGTDAEEEEAKGSPKKTLRGLARLRKSLAESSATDDDSESDDKKLPPIPPPTPEASSETAADSGGVNEQDEQDEIAQGEGVSTLEESTEPDPGGRSLFDDAPLAEDPPEEDFEEVDQTTVSLMGSPAMASEPAVEAPESADSTGEANGPAGERPAGERGDVLPPKHPTFDPFGETDLNLTEETPLEAEPPEEACDESPEASSDDDFYSEKTEVFDSPYQHDVVVPKLSVLGGPDAGQEFLVNQNRNTIGRGKHNSIVVSDPAMSRQHLEIVKRGPSHYGLVDLQSANGTRLNDTPVREAELFHGDRIEAGKTQLQFIVPGSAPQQRSERRRLVPAATQTATDNPTMVSSMAAPSAPATDDPTDRILTAVIIGAGVLSVVLLGAALYLYFGDAGEGVRADSTGGQARAEKLYMKGVERVKARDWEEANAHFEQVRDLDSDFPGLDAQFRRVEREHDAKRELDRAKRALDEGSEDRAAETAMGISNKSVYFDDAQKLVRQTRQHRVASNYERAQKAVTDEAYDRADGYLDEILAQVPDHQGALELRETIEAERDGGDHDDRDDDKQDRDESDDPEPRTDDGARAASSKGSTEESDRGGAARPAGQKPSGRINFTEGFSLYRDGQFDKAAAYFRKAADDGAGRATERAEALASNIDQFGEVYSGANRTLEAGAWRRAIHKLERARTLDTRVARTGYFRSAIDEKLAEAHAEQGMADLKAKRYAQAAHHQAKAREYDTSHQSVTTLKRELSNEARSHYIQAANKQKTDPDKSAQLCEQIKQMVPADHSMHQKADRLLDKLE